MLLFLHTPCMFADVLKSSHTDGFTASSPRNTPIVRWVSGSKPKLLQEQAGPFYRLTVGCESYGYPLPIADGQPGILFVFMHGTLLRVFISLFEALYMRDAYSIVYIDSEYMLSHFSLPCPQELSPCACNITRSRPAYQQLHYCDIAVHALPSRRRYDSHPDCNHVCRCLSPHLEHFQRSEM